MFFTAVWPRQGFFSNERQIFVRQISIHRGKFLRDFAKSGKPRPPLKQMFGDMQMSSLVDMIQAALMLKYNGRKVG